VEFKIRAGSGFRHVVGRLCKQLAWTSRFMQQPVHGPGTIVCFVMGICEADITVYDAPRLGACAASSCGG
jgi:hypothetical protein